MDGPLENPFRPGTGLAPPLMAGRDGVVRRLSERIDRVRGGENGGFIVLIGPRGNGKTALLRELQGMAAKHSLRQVELTAAGMSGDPADLARALAPGRRSGPGVFRRLIDKLLGRAAGKGPDASRHGSPMLLVVDDAHKMPPDFGRTLLPVTQDCVREGLPLMVALAGTPGVQDHLKRMLPAKHQCERIRVGRLEDGAAADALAIPARDSGMPIDEDALRLLVRRSEGYPPFVQRLGHEAWNAARDRGGAQQITLADARKGAAAMRKGLRPFLDRRRDELRRHDVLREAEAVAGKLVTRGRDARLTETELMDAVEAVAVPNGRDPEESFEALAHLGVVWETDRPEWESGIPSLCAFLVEHAGESDRGRRRRAARPVEQDLLSSD